MSKPEGDADMVEDGDDLRKLLTTFRVIYAETADDPDTRRYSILWRAMIDHLIASRPESVQEWPDHLLRNTEPDHWRRYAHPGNYRPK